MEDLSNVFASGRKSVRSVRAIVLNQKKIMLGGMQTFVYKRDGQPDLES